MNALTNDFAAAFRRPPASLSLALAPCHDPGELLHQATVARALGSSFVAAVLEAAHRQLDRAPLTAAFLMDWPGDPASAALAMRLNGALHALARRGAPPALAALYEGRHADFDGAIGDAMATQDAFIANWMLHPPQTNEVGRAAALISALMVATTGLPFELLELGSSCGLNLNLALYAYRLGGATAGDAGSPVRIVPDWSGPPPPIRPIAVAAARGVDLHPLDAADALTRERLLSFIWADQPARARRLEQALGLARANPPRIDRADGAAWLAERLAEPQPAGRHRVVFHSMVLQYLTAERRDDVRATIARAGERAEPGRPLAWISFEWNGDRSATELTLTTWPGGTTRRLATCHPYGSWIDWLAPDAAVADAAA